MSVVYRDKEEGLWRGRGLEKHPGSVLSAAECRVWCGGCVAWPGSPSAEGGRCEGRGGADVHLGTAAAAPHAAPSSYIS